MKGKESPRRMITHGAHNTPQSGSKKQRLAAQGRWKLRHGMQPNREERRAMGKEDR